MVALFGAVILGKITYSLTTVDIEEDYINLLKMVHSCHNHKLPLTTAS